MKRLLFALAALIGLAAAPAVDAATPWPLGVFPPTTAYSGGYSTEQTFNSQMGVSFVPVQNFYVDFTQTPGTNGSNWLGSSNYNMGGFTSYTENGGPNNSTNPWLPSSGVIPMGDIPMVTTNNAGPSYETVLQNYAAGTYDSFLQGVVQNWYNSGYHTQYWRPGVEMNEYSSNPAYSCGTDSTCLGYWRAAFQHIYTTMHAEASSIGATIQIVWNPGADAGGLIDPSGSAAYWPGASYVDIIGLDLYGNAYQDNSNNPCSNYTNVSANLTCDSQGGGTAFGFLEAIAFAKAQGKPLGFPELGAGGNSDGPGGDGDNPLFPAWVAQILIANKVNVAFVSLWDSNGGCTCAFTPASSAGKPNEAAAFTANFGNGAPGETVVASTPSAVGTELTGPIGQIEDSTSDIFKMTLGRQISINGTTVASSANVTALLQTSSGVEQLAGGVWYTVPANGSAGATVATPSGYVAPHAESALDTTIGVNASTPIYDPFGDYWNITTGGQITANGQVVPSSSGVTNLFLDANGLLDQLTGTGWYTQPEDGTPGVAISTPTGYTAGGSGSVAITLTPSTQVATVNDYANGNPFLGVVLTDTNSGQTETVTITVGTPANGTLTDPNSGTDGSTITSGVVHLSGTAAAVSTAINGIVFNPTNQGAIGTHVTTVITVAVTDTSGQTASATSTVTANQISTAATLTSHC
jgi:hypothetical protein